MFTYDQIPITDLRTSQDIEKFGHQSLIRALNIGRVVAFVGSGSSRKFGHPSWSDTANQAKQQFNALAKTLEIYRKQSPKEFGIEFDLKLKPLAVEINRLHGEDGLPQNHFVELCEDFCADGRELLTRYGGPVEMSTPSFRSDNTCDQFRDDFARQFELFDPKKQKKQLRRSDKFLDLIKDISSDPRLFEKAMLLDEFGADVSNIDATRALRTNLGIRRYLTLNYDLELEQMLLEEGRATPLDIHQEFKKFLAARSQGSSDSALFEAGRAASLNSPSGRVLRSTSSRSNTLADLFSFGAFPTNYDASVHHLHGRVDDPANMIITPKDYQRIYYGINDQKKSFDEARHAVFTGSDIFVLGMGSSESDVLGPLRDFLELETERRDAHGKVYYITTSEFFGDGDLAHAKTGSKTAAMAKAHELYKEYGMHTLFVDQSLAGNLSEEDSRKRAEIFEARAEISYFLGCLEKDDIPTVWTATTACAEIELARKVVTAIPKQNNRADKILAARRLMIALDSRLKDRALVEYVDYLKAARKDWWERWSELPGMRFAIFGPHFYKRELGDKALEIIPNESMYPLVWRQTNLATEIDCSDLELGNEAKAPQLTKLLQITAEARDTARCLWKRPKQSDDRSLFPATVARVSIASGGGKGRLLSFFTNKQTLLADKKAKKGRQAEILPFQALFRPEIVGDGTKKIPLESWDDKTPYYHACFAAHLTFTLEFSSCMIGFARLLQQLLPKLRSEWRERGNKKNDQGLRDEWNALLEFQFHQTRNVEPCLKTLTRMFALLKKSCPDNGWETRMVGFFSYLDRLVDDEGDAHSPIHRHFFRLISGWNDEQEHMSLPIDIVLINSRADKPIRYLSKEQNIGDEEDRRDQKWQNKSYQFRHNRKVAIENWSELPRVRPRIIFIEALEHAAYCSPIGPRGKQSTLPNAKDSANAIRIYLGIRSDDSDFLELPEGLRKFLYRRVANGHFFAGLANAIYRRCEHLKRGRKAHFRALWEEAVSALDIAFTREKTSGFVDELLGVYRRLDRPQIDQTKREPTSRRITTKREQSLERLRTLIVDHMALLNHPISTSTLRACPDIAKVKRAGNIKNYEFQIELDKLVARGLACRYYKFSARINLKTGHGNPTGKDDFVYALDTKVSSALRSRAGLEVYSNYRLVAFQPSLFPSQPERSLKPDLTHFKRVSEIVRSLVKSSHFKMLGEYNSIQDGKSDIFEDPVQFSNFMEDYNEKLRTAYALIRGTFSISVIARLAEHKKSSGLVPFDEYRTWTRKLLNTATLLGKITDQYSNWVAKQNPADEKHKLTIPFNQPFFRDEISWLYNERALVSFVQGRLFDALPLFDQSREMLGTSIQRSDPVSYGATHRRVLMNFSLAQMERGNIVTAQNTLEQILVETQPRWSGDTPSVVHCMARGYLALCHHLTNDFPRAEKGYKKAIREIAKFDHPRADSIFRRHYGDLMRAMSKSRNDPHFKEAIAMLRSSEELALGIRAADLQNYALMAQARLNRDMENRVNALDRLRQVEAFATRMGAQKMQAEVLKVRGEVLLAEGETAQAGNVTSQSIALSKRNGMKLRKISAAIVQAKILRERNQYQDSMRLLKETIAEAQMLGYATKTSQAMRALERIR